MTAPNTTVERPEQLLAGYELVDRIGAGGYGEVWSARAPGGLLKAIKYVYGTQLEKRATHELRALEKVKSVRHPFLLSLERIEVVDDRLLIVTELADGSLRDRFRQCIEQGLPGIPREELLGYLHDAADSLDFLATTHDLAHLDVKPENLLLVAGHVKVADFGLVKSIANVTQGSLVAGMTPTYAAPELFRGSPTRQSDQYSLAIMYQELLTGMLPFPGINAAELTMQHLNGDPDLSMLQDADRFVIARALAKDASHRYETAAKFVDALVAGGSTTFGDSSVGVASSAPRTRSPATAPKLSQVTTSARPDHANATEVFEDAGAKAAPARVEIQFDLPPLDADAPVEEAFPPIDADSFLAEPTVVIGIGGAAGRVLRSLRALMSQRFGVSDPLAALPMLLLDTDASALTWASRGAETGVGLTASETLSLPLRRPHAYRDRSEQVLRWLGRRWLYNIPRSLTTEGIRPLGRLALVDHARRTFQRIRSVIQDAVREESLVAAETATGVKFRRGKIRVQIVASISGGTGSGMSLDVAYAVRALLDRLEGVETSVTGVMLHSTYRETTRCDLARVNAYSWLSEHEHHRTCGEGYPGDPSCGLPAHAPGVPAFDVTYVAPLGEQLDTASFDIATRGVADYLFADTLTPAHVALEAWRAGDDQESAPLRSFAVTRRQARGRDELSAVENAAAQVVVGRWIGADDDDEAAAVGSTDPIVHGAVAFIGETQLDAPTLTTNCRNLLEAALGGDARAYTAASVESDAEQALSADPESVFEIDQTSGRPTRVDSRTLADIVKPIVEKLTAQVSRWTLSKIDDDGERVPGARRSIGWCRDHVRAVAVEIEQMAATVQAEWTAIAVQSVGEHDVAPRRFSLRLDQAAIEAASSVATAVLRHTIELDQDLQSLSKVMSRIAERLDESVVEESEEPTRPDAQLVQCLEERLTADHLGPAGGLLAAISTSQSTKDLLKAVVHAARTVVAEYGAEQDGFAEGELRFADLPLKRFGGRYARLAVAPPAEVLSPSCREALASVTHIIGGSRESVLISEMAGMSLPHVAGDLIGCRRDYAAFAERVRTRRDVPWIDIVDASKPVESPELASSTSWSSTPMDTAVVG
ncbi:MAG: tubulin-like doman-containing protein [Planctomycetota bacterium]